MTKAEIIERIYEQVNLSKKEAAELVDGVFETVKNTLEKGENIKISRFGNFEVRKKADRKGRNPQTGEEITITSRRVLCFKPSKILRERVNIGHDSITS